MKTAFVCGLVLLAGFAWSAGAAGPRHGGRAFFAAYGGYGAAPAHAPQGYLGVDVRDVTNEQVGVLRLKDTHGAEITLVDHDAPAGKVGLREHDVVLQLNGQGVEGEEQVKRMLRDCAPGKTVVLVISRDGQQMTVRTQMANREQLERQAWEQHLTVAPPAFVPAPATETSENDSAGNGSVPASNGSAVRAGNSFMGRLLLMNPSYTGAMLEMMSKQLADFFGSATGSGLLVRSVEANSPAALAGMRAGDVVVKANAQVLASTKDWLKAIESSHGRPVAVVVLRDKKETTLTLTPDGKKRSKVEWPGPGFGWMARFV